MPRASPRNSNSKNRRLVVDSVKLFGSDLGGREKEMEQEKAQRRLHTIERQVQHRRAGAVALGRDSSSARVYVPFSGQAERERLRGASLATLSILVARLRRQQLHSTWQRLASFCRLKRLHGAVDLLCVGICATKERVEARWQASVLQVLFNACRSASRLSRGVFILDKCARQAGARSKATTIESLSGLTKLERFRGEAAVSRARASADLEKALATFEKVTLTARVFRLSETLRRRYERVLRASLRQWGGSVACGKKGRRLRQGPCSAPGDPNGEEKRGQREQYLKKKMQGMIKSFPKRIGGREAAAENHSGEDEGEEEGSLRCLQDMDLLKDFAVSSAFKTHLKYDVQKPFRMRLGLDTISRFISVCRARTVASSFHLLLRLSSLPKNPPTEEKTDDQGACESTRALSVLSFLFASALRNGTTRGARGSLALWRDMAQASVARESEKRCSAETLSAALSKCQRLCAGRIAVTSLRNHSRTVERREQGKKEEQTQKMAISRLIAERLRSLLLRRSRLAFSSLVAHAAAAAGKDRGSKMAEKRAAAFVRAGDMRASRLRAISLLSGVFRRSTSVHAAAFVCRLETLASSLLCPSARQRQVSFSTGITAGVATLTAFMRAQSSRCLIQALSKWASRARNIGRDQREVNAAIALLRSRLKGGVRFLEGVQRRGGICRKREVFQILVGFRARLLWMQEGVREEERRQETRREALRSALCAVSLQLRRLESVSRLVLLRRGAEMRLRAAGEKAGGSRSRGRQSVTEMRFDFSSFKEALETSCIRLSSEQLHSLWQSACDFEKTRETPSRKEDLGFKSTPQHGEEAMLAVQNESEGGGNEKRHPHIESMKEMSFALCMLPIFICAYRPDTHTSLSRSYLTEGRGGGENAVSTDASVRFLCAVLKSCRMRRVHWIFSSLQRKSDSHSLPSSSFPAPLSSPDLREDERIVSTEHSSEKGNPSVSIQAESEAHERDSSSHSHSLVLPSSSAAAAAEKREPVADEAKEREANTAAALRAFCRQGGILSRPPGLPLEPQLISSVPLSLSWLIRFDLAL
uniref:Uncharacterized protein n=1 Tax=Chromera velia CCMP2878 TaxID=1169474 RepID=A0A0G4FYT2_9ALVE|eukprot:Cvel_19429.t1-p1 / transcript=Cvel_19429.t1 / gene=Cvel_19429 / organism=Chromera_velia_CCMP2878 / gene_product=hypothetical protein / transcript_product=hypothetical protein / location=Cvel_scaffold1673:33416-38667(+) / protein_length=1046 / sequence_SO=supercontig / SO=protein_coding / is_pseudo=false